MVSGSVSATEGSHLSPVRPQLTSAPSMAVSGWSDSQFVAQGSKLKDYNQKSPLSSQVGGTQGGTPGPHCGGAGRRREACGRFWKICSTHPSHRPQLTSLPHAEYTRLPQEPSGPILRGLGLRCEVQDPVVGLREGLPVLAGAPCPGTLALLLSHASSFMRNLSVQLSPPASFSEC